MRKRTKNLVLLGAGDFLHEIIWLIAQIPATARDWELRAVLDDDPAAAQRRLKEKGLTLPVVDTTLAYRPQSGDCFALAVGSPKIKLAMAARLLSRGAEFINLSHPSLTVMQNAVIGKGCVFMARTVVGPYARLGDFVTINNNSGVAHDTSVEDGVTVSAFCDVTGRAVVHRGAFLGSHAVVLPGRKVGEFATVGAGSVVLRDVPAGSTVFGVYAKEIC